MRLAWSVFVQHLFATPDRPRDRLLPDIAKFAIGFCPACRRLRGAASVRCLSCGSAAPVTDDA
jgi:hypothetical protein